MRGDEFAYGELTEDYDGTYIEEYKTLAMNIISYMKEFPERIKNGTPKGFVFSDGKEHNAVMLSGDPEIRKKGRKAKKVATQYEDLVKIEVFPIFAEALPIIVFTLKAA